MYFFLECTERCSKQIQSRNFKVLFKSVGNVQIISLSVASFVCNHIKQLQIDLFKFVNFSRFTNFSIELKTWFECHLCNFCDLFFNLQWQIELFIKKINWSSHPHATLAKVLRWIWTEQTNERTKKLSNAHSLGIYCHWYVFSIRVLAISWLR